ncbi:uncharacterized protein EV154DRAFT_428704, partial [Mucor mucedo]|uniref:uncharacterized protein n=1 Tax=Mucor mucedo TaxID=29922 RepID=UPI002220EA53
VEIKKNKKLFQFSRPISHQFLVINKPRITDKDASLIKSTFEIFIASSPSTPTSIIITEEYNSNMKDQDANECLKKLPKVQEFLMQAIDGNYANFLDRVMCYKADNYHSKNEVQAINLLKYILIDYHANCEKPAYYTGTNERTPYCEHIIPVFKYFSAVYKNLSFMWQVKEQANHLIFSISNPFCESQQV